MLVAGGCDCVGVDVAGGVDVDCDGVLDVGGLVGLLPVPPVLFAGELFIGVLPVSVDVDCVSDISGADVSAGISVSLAVGSDVPVIYAWEASPITLSSGVVFFSVSCPQAVRNNRKHTRIA